MQEKVSARIDADLKKEEFGLSADPFYSESNMNYINNLIEEYETGKIKTEEHELIRN